jgi:hypothetical protein
MAGANIYSLNHWEVLNSNLLNGLLEINNNRLAVKLFTRSINISKKAFSGRANFFGNLLLQTQDIGFSEITAHLAIRPGELIINIPHGLSRSILTINFIKNCFRKKIL